jgi:hypothetical protein
MFKFFYGLTEEDVSRESDDIALAGERPCSSEGKLVASCRILGGSIMVKVHAQAVGTEKALIDRAELQRLIDAARRVEEVELIEVQDDLPTEGLMRLVQEGGSFEFLADPREEIYTLNDLKVRYR